MSHNGVKIYQDGPQSGSSTYFQHTDAENIGISVNLY